MEYQGVCECNEPVYYDGDECTLVFSCDKHPCSIVTEDEPIFKPCPFCGEADEEKINVILLAKGGDFVVYCEGCGALGPPAGTSPGAHYAWQDRS